MKRLKGWLLGPALMGSALISSALALTPMLNPQQIQDAAQAGDQMFHKSGVYTWGPYLLKAYTEDVILKPDSPEVDGIALGTPYERLRYKSFLASFQAMPLTPAQATAQARALDNKITFLLYTHSPFSVDEEEEQWQKANKGAVSQTPDRAHSYLDSYQPATLNIGGRTLTASPQIDGPYTDQFTLPTGNADFRYLGVVRYTFDLGGTAQPGTVTLSFKDSQGKPFTQQADLGQLR